MQQLGTSGNSSERFNVASGSVAVQRYSEHRRHELELRRRLIELPTDYRNITMPSFDVVCEANLVEVKNANDQANKEISTRFDFKGTDARIEQKERELTAYADSDFQLAQVRDVLTAKLVKRNVDVRFLDIGKIEKIGGDKVKQVIKIKNGIESEDAKKIVRIVKDSKTKVQASIQGDAVRITGAKRDDLQATIALLRKDVDMPLEFNNFRD
jgi:uncharacterized protein YajQ (UPF0234 family)